MKFLNTHFKRCIAAVILAGILTGCSTVGHIFGKNSAKEKKQADKIAEVQGQLAGNLQTQMGQLAQITYGVDYALSKENVPSKNVEVAKDLNSKAMSITGTPTIEEMTKMKQMVDDLTSQLQEEKDRGEKERAALNQELGAVQQEKKDLLASKDAEIAKYIKFAQETAQKADSNAAELAKMNKWFGLGAVFYGLKHFVISMAWIIGGLSLLYLILRLAAASNPIAASAFSIFETVVSWVVHGIQLAAPKAISIAGHIPTAVSDVYKTLLTKMIDNVEALQVQEKSITAKGGTPPKYTIADLLEALAKSMDTDEKALVAKIKTDIGY